MQVKQLISVLFGLCLSLAHAFAKPDWPELPFPDNSRVISVAENMTFNGVPMKIWELKTTMHPDRLEQFYANIWEADKSKVPKGAPPFVKSRVQGATILSRVEGEFMITVQFDQEEQKSSSRKRSASSLQAARESNLHSTSAQVGISRLLEERPIIVLGKGFILPSDAKVMNDIEAFDGDKKSRTILASSAMSVNSVLSFYKSALERKGWSTPFPDLGIPTQGLLYEKAGQEMNISIVKNPRDGLTHIVAVHVVKQ